MSHKRVGVEFRGEGAGEGKGGVCRKSLSVLVGPFLKFH